ncbi:MAG: glycosyltransferase, partial [Acidimicrobiia bacterium]
PGSADGVWEAGASDDAIGRGIWGLGAAAIWWPDETGRVRALRRLQSGSGAVRLVSHARTMF